MEYVHTFDFVNYTRLHALENGLESGFLEFTLQKDNILKIDDFQSGCNDPNYHQGTEMILYLLNSFSFTIKKIHGRLSTEDAIQKYKEIGTNTHKLTGWQTSIPFYANLEKYINNSTFHLYTGSHSYREDITDKYNENPQKTIIDLINENQDCSFSIDIDNA